MPPQGPIRWHHLSEVDTDREAYVLWTRTGGEVVADLSTHLDPSMDWAAIEPHRGHYRFVDTTGIPVRAAGTILVPADHVVSFDWLSDLNASGSVDVSDLLIMLEQWGDCDNLPATCHSDLNGDGLVEVDDLLQLLDEWS